MATVRDIARKVGVSPATVSRSLNNAPDVSEEVRLRVLEEAKRVGYRVVSRRSSATCLGITFLNETSGLRYSGYDGVIWSGVARAAHAAKADLMLLDLQQRAPGESFAGFLRRKGVGGLVVRTDAHTRGMCLELADASIPFVVVADRFDDPRISYVRCVSGEQSKAAIEHLLHLGHRRIALAYHSVLDADHQDRIDAHAEVMATAGVEPDPNLSLQIVADVDGGAAAVSKLMSLPEPPTAIFFTDPGSTVGALRRAQELGIRVPDELSIIGVDDEQMRRWTHPVYTAVVQQAPEIGYQAGRWLSRAIAEGKPKPKHLEPLRLDLQAFLEINGTTGAVPRRAVRVAPNGHRIGPDRILERTENPDV